ncbi:MAG: TetR/AcrR family transcriptional regulator [Bacteroidetes bacterium]|nr:TetR/AcrR family transcriptional regulator [Bacteroidota bacterium]MDA1122447.1 TetR/AcrR family transcriptional regulator [Bacteroidota bacterium]
MKDPESSNLGKDIVEHGIELIAEIGFEAFTFKKLGGRIGSPESSIYRYFENKHKLLLYLTSWYWSWMEYRLYFSLTNINSPQNRLERAVVLLTELIEEDSSFSHVNEVKLNQIVITESPKSYLTKEVDQENNEGIFAGYKQLVARVSDIILEINPDYKYPHMLVSTVIEGAHFQRYFVKHLPRLTDVVKGENSITEFYLEMVSKAIK